MHVLVGKQEPSKSLLHHENVFKDVDAHHRSETSRASRLHTRIDPSNDKQGSRGDRSLRSCPKRNRRRDPARGPRRVLPSSPPQSSLGHVWSVVAFVDDDVEDDAEVEAFADGLVVAA
jgi:hypothetical protein